MNLYDPNQVVQVVTLFKNVLKGIFYSCCKIRTCSDMLKLGLFHKVITQHSQHSSKSMREYFLLHLSSKPTNHVFYSLDETSHIIFFTFPSVDRSTSLITLHSSVVSLSHIHTHTYTHAVHLSPHVHLPSCYTHQPVVMHASHAVQL